MRLAGWLQLASRPLGWLYFVQMPFLPDTFGGRLEILMGGLPECYGPVQEGKGRYSLWKDSPCGYL